MVTCWYLASDLELGLRSRGLRSRDLMGIWPDRKRKECPSHLCHLGFSPLPQPNTLHFKGKSPEVHCALWRALLYGACEGDVWSSMSSVSNPIDLALLVKGSWWCFLPPLLQPPLCAKTSAFHRIITGMFERENQHLKVGQQTSACFCQCDFDYDA